ncbi:MAG: DUF5710 domain-containing protein [Moraxella sp.]|nr:DUF5710 domain-containing protein [Moraxella sp.]
MTQEKTYLYVPYEDKDAAAKLGAKWHRANNTWYVPKGVDLNKFDRWQDEQKLSQAVLQQDLRPQDTTYLQMIGKDFDGAKIERAAKSFDEVREIAKEFVGKEITNSHDGFSVIISNKKRAVLD